MSCSRKQCSDAGEDPTRNPLASSQALYMYHWATVLPFLKLDMGCQFEEWIVTPVSNAWHVWYLDASIIFEKKMWMCNYHADTDIVLAFVIIWHISMKYYILNKV